MAIQRWIPEGQEDGEMLAATSYIFEPPFDLVRA
jgi:hypothetical protein